MRRTIYIFIGGAYAEYYSQSTQKPSQERWDAWQSGELTMIKVTPSLQSFEPGPDKSWSRIKRQH